MVTGFDTTATSALASSVSGLSLKGAIQFANVNGMDRGSVNPDKNNFAPRVGVAYKLNDKTVLRAGYGLYILGQSATGSNTGFSITTSASTTTDGGLTPAVTLTNAFANQNSGQLLTAKGTATNYYGLSINGNYMERPLPYSHQYSFDIQRELPYNILFEIGYSGNQTRKLPVSASLNYIPASLMGQASSYYTTKVSNPMAGLITNNSSLNGSTIANYYLLYAFPQYSQVTMNNIPMGKSRYDAKNLKATRRFSNGFTFIASYTLAKNLEQVNLVNAQDLNTSDYTATKLEKRPAKELDTPNKLNVTGVYEFPLGRGRHFGADLAPALDKLIGGWSVNWDYSYQTGWAVAYPNAAQTCSGSAKLDSPTASKWFNTACWTGTAKGSYELQTYPTYFSDVRLPAYNNLDVSLAKYFPIHDRLRLQFRLEAINAFNHPWFEGIQSVDVTSSNFGKLTATQSNLPRYLKLGLNLQW
jgi:hypothetical protein